MIAIVCLHPSVSLNNESICREISEDKMQFVRKLRVYGARTFGFELSVFVVSVKFP
jgi:hypothetical protein